MKNSPGTNQNIAVVLSFGQGTFESGLSVAAKVLENGKLVEQRDRIQIPAVPELKSRYQIWKQYYLAQGRTVARSGRALDLPPAVVGHSSVEDCRNAASSLLSYLNQCWFKSVEFQALKDWIRSRAIVKIDESVPIFFEFDTHSREQDILLQRLPWSRWDLFREIPNAEPTLGIAFNRPVSPVLRNIKVLAVFGSDERGLDLEADRRFVSELKKIGAQITPLSCPSPDALYAELKQNFYDVLFFAGHSLSEENQQDGEILIDSKTSVSIDALSSSLKTAVGKGLKLAIFNSCDGLGLAEPLIKKEKIPSVVVFREPVPDEVARTFLKHFLQEFSSGKPLFLSMREARNRLRWLEDRSENPLPGASWLPVVCQNPSQSEMIIGSRRLKIGWIKGLVAVLVLSALGGVAYRVALGERQFPSDPSSETLISRGDKLAIPSKISDAKKEGIEAYAAAASSGDWDKAIAAFRKSLYEEWRSGGSLDPETWIYLNNAIAEKKTRSNFGQMVKLAMEIPAKSNEIDHLLGGEKDISKELLRGGALRQAEFNCGVETLVKAVKDSEASLDCNGTQGRFIHITIADDRDMPETAQKAAAALSEESVLGVVGPFSSDSCRSAGEVYKERKIVVISPTCTSTKLSGLNDYFFRTVPSDAVAAKRLWNSVTPESGRVAIAYMQEGSEYSESFKTAFQALLPEKEYVYTCQSLGANFSANQCTKGAEEKRAEFLLLIPSTTEVLNSTLSILNVDDLSVGITPLGSDSVYNSIVLENHGAQAAKTGLRVYVSWYPDPKNLTPFEDSATQFFNIKGWNWRTQSSYDAMSALAKGVLELGNNPSGEALKNRLHSGNFAADGVFGAKSVKFLPSGDRDLSGFEDKIGVVVRVEEYQDGYGETKYRFKRVDE